jgi:hypothetical protein
MTEWCMHVFPEQRLKKLIKINFKLKLCTLEVLSLVSDALETLLVVFAYLKTLKKPISKRREPHMIKMALIHTVLPFNWNT